MPQLLMGEMNVPWKFLHTEVCAGNDAMPVPLATVSATSLSAAGRSTFMSTISIAYAELRQACLALPL
jgi:hypothetical protein